MKTFILDTISIAAGKLGMSKVIQAGETISVNNLPCIEIEYFTDAYTPSGRKIAKCKENGEQISINEHYEIQCAVSASIIDTDAARLNDLAYGIAVALPATGTDQRDNSVDIRISKAEWNTMELCGQTAYRRDMKMIFSGRITSIVATPFMTKFYLNTTDK